MKNILKIFISAFLISSFVNAQTAQSKPLEFKIKTINNKTFNAKELKNGIEFKEFKGKIVLLEFWGTHCPPCLYSIEHYKELTKKYKDKVAMLAVEVQMTPKEQLKNFVKSKGINYNIATQEDNMNFIRYIASRAGWRGAIPYLIIFDQKGNVVDIHRGYASKEYVEKIINYLLNKKDSKDSNSTNK